MEMQIRRLVAIRPDFDTRALTLEMRERRREMGLSIKVISEALNVPATECEHWFRLDRYGSPPSPDVWGRVRALLGITGWDEVGVVEYRDNVYEMGEGPTTRGVSAPRSPWRILRWW